MKYILSFSRHTPTSLTLFSTVWFLVLWILEQVLQKLNKHKNDLQIWFKSRLWFLRSCLEPESLHFLTGSGAARLRGLCPSHTIAATPHIWTQHIQSSKHWQELWPQVQPQAIPKSKPGPPCTVLQREDKRTWHHRTLGTSNLQACLPLCQPCSCERPSTRHLLSELISLYAQLEPELLATDFTASRPGWNRKMHANSLKNHKSVEIGKLSFWFPWWTWKTREIRGEAIPAASSCEYWRLRPRQWCPLIPL